jgi:hypothetical protein
MSNCKCEYVEEVNPIQSGVRIHKLVKRCEECEEANTKARADMKVQAIENLKQHIKLLEVDILSARTLGHLDIVESKEATLKAAKEELNKLEEPVKIEEEPKPKRKKK